MLRYMRYEMRIFRLSIVASGHDGSLIARPSRSGYDEINPLVLSCSCQYPLDLAMLGSGMKLKDGYEDEQKQTDLLRLSVRIEER
ncbi:hypothetical protein WN944_005861 [Citrus x changshan-huyou]|uniref:Uncharacterized protein n=1 Tax=Citrus x changshan-huyou TaxID=2935761 RepID=A0AAP0MMY6_9ROSI